MYFEKIDDTKVALNPEVREFSLRKPCRETAPRRGEVMATLLADVTASGDDSQHYCEA
jgi:hypothetical protein